jgi:predicted dehydrogenase
MPKKYGVGALGTAWTAQTPLPTFKTYDETEIIAIGSGRLERAQLAADYFGAKYAFSDYLEVINHPEVDIVYIGSPVYLHKEMVMAAAKAGKPLMCEKPMAVSSQEAREIVDAVTKANVPNVVLFTMRNFAENRYLEKLRNEGFFGEIRNINGLNWNPSAPGNRPGWGWQNDASLGGGIIGGLGSHFLDLIRWLFGEWQSVSAVTSIVNETLADPQGVERPVTAEQSFSMFGILETGARATVQVNVVGGPVTPRRFEVYGTHGTVDCEGKITIAPWPLPGPKPEFAGYGPGILDYLPDVRIGKAGERTLAPIECPDPDFTEAVRNCAVPRFGEMLRKLIDQIEGREVDAPTVVDGLRCQEVMDAIQISAAEGRRVDIAEVRK